MQLDGKCKRAAISAVVILLISASVPAVAKDVRFAGRVVLPDWYDEEVMIRVARPGADLGAEPTADWSQNSLTFDGVATPGIYVIQVFAPPEGEHFFRPARYFSSVSVDLRSGAKTNIVVPPARGALPFHSRKAPDASRVSFGVVDVNGIAEVVGAPGAAASLAAIMIANHGTGQYALGVSEENGSFRIPMFAPPGASLSVHHDQTGWGGTVTGAGTVVRRPPQGDPDRSFATMQAISWVPEGDPDQGVQDGGQIWFGGNVSDRHWDRGQQVTLEGTLRIHSRNLDLANLSSVEVYVLVWLERIFDEQGRQGLPNPIYSSQTLTPTGLPIERQNGGEIWLSDQTGCDSVRFERVADFTAESACSLDFTVRDDLPDGIYRLGVDLSTNQVIPTDPLHFEGVFPVFFARLHRDALLLARLGNPAPPRLSLALALSDFGNGGRGTVAKEIRGSFATAGRVVTSPGRLILPMHDPSTGVRHSYRFDPFAPLVAAENRGWLNPPAIPFEYPSGSLRGSIRFPSGKKKKLKQGRPQASVQAASAPDGGSISGNNAQSYFGLTTRHDSWERTFEEYGRHEIGLDGHIFDIWGDRYEVDGTFDIWVARALDLETGVFPNTAFEVGDVFSPAVVVQPGVPADVEVRVRLFSGGDAEMVLDRTVTGRANRFGYFHPAGHEPIVLSQPGEYRVDYSVSYTDGEGVLWMGSAAWASVVETPNSPLVAHGERGVEGFPQGALAWFENLDAPRGDDNPHLLFPFHRGDIMWMRDGGSPDFANVPRVNVQDTQGDLADQILERASFYEGHYPLRPPGNDDLEFRRAQGEIPLFSTAAATGLRPELRPNRPGNHWAYSYAGAARPGVRVRELVMESHTPEGYWRFDDPYYHQLGNGANGDLPNDFKFQFGGAVYRIPDEDKAYYAAYGSLWVLVDDDQIGRLMPPFQGAAGGPDGGPIMTLKGKEIDLFFHPGGVRPGTVLEVGDVASFAGQIAPTLDSKVKITVKPPEGKRRRIKGRANKVGHFHDPSKDFVVDVPGVWEAKVTVIHDRETSAGRVQGKKPKGDVLGSRKGKFWFYVVEPDSPQLDVDIERLSFVRPGEEDVVFDIQEPSGLSKVQYRQTTVMPGFVLEETRPRSSYVYDARSLADDFPNLDLRDGDGRSGVDTVTITLFAEGKEDGAKKYRARQILLQGEELMALPQSP